MRIEETFDMFMSIIMELILIALYVYDEYNITNRDINTFFNYYLKLD